MLPDQDVLNAVYATRIITVDHLRYNLSERCFHLYNLRPENWEQPLTLSWVRQNTAIVHYCGRNKPWNENYIGELNHFYLELEQQAIAGGLL
ncbi:MAG: glycosyl transferase family 8 [Oscillospiraceae bacterium]|jgi:lipopolysaccharide biosynthesis glycosyltransferase|nr:glycosyl transferase family 8 [Oscillospiraceae bacterium]